MCPKTERGLSVLGLSFQEKWALRTHLEEPIHGWLTYATRASKQEPGRAPTTSAIARGPRRLKCYVAGLLCGSGALRGRAWPAIRAEHGHLHAAILLPVVPGLFVVHWLVFAQPHDLDAVHGHVVLRYEIGVHGLCTPTAELEVVFGRARLVREAFNGHEVALHAPDLPSTELVELLFGFIGQLRGIEFEEHHDVARRLVVVKVRDALAEFGAKIGLHLVGFLGGRVRTPKGVARARIGGVRLFRGCADLGLVTFQVFLRALRLFFYFVDLRVDGIGLLGDILLGRTTCQ